MGCSPRLFHDHAEAIQERLPLGIVPRDVPSLDRRGQESATVCQPDSVDDAGGKKCSAVCHCGIGHGLLQRGNADKFTLADAHHYAVSEKFGAAGIGRNQHTPGFGVCDDGDFRWLAVSEHASRIVEIFLPKIFGQLIEIGIAGDHERLAHIDGSMAPGDIAFERKPRGDGKPSCAVDCSFGRNPCLHRGQSRNQFECGTRGVMVLDGMIEVGIAGACNQRGSICVVAGVGCKGDYIAVARIDGDNGSRLSLKQECCG